MSLESLPSTHYQERIQHFCKSLQSVVFSFWHQKQRPDKITEKVTVHFANLLQLKVVIQRLDKKTFVSGLNKFRIEIGMVSHITFRRPKMKGHW